MKIKLEINGIIGMPTRHYLEIMYPKLKGSFEFINDTRYKDSYFRSTEIEVINLEDLLGNLKESGLDSTFEVIYHTWEYVEVRGEAQ